MNATSPPRARARHRRLEETSRLIATEWRFAPGAETGWHRHEHDYLVVCLTAGVLLAESAEGETRRTLAVGETYARPRGVEHNIVNDGPQEFAFVEIELK